MIVHVTAEHIRRGTPGSYTHCPVALAIKDALGDVLPLVCVYSSEILIDHDVFPCPGPVIDFINDFDDEKPVEPLSFELPEIA